MLTALHLGDSVLDLFATVFLGTRHVNTNVDLPVLVNLFNSVCIRSPGVGIRWRKM